MIVSFPFTFSFSVPGLPNPFSPNYSGPQAQATSPASEPEVHTHSAFQSILHTSAEPTMAPLPNRLQSSPSPSFTNITKPNNLKRGWEPAFAEPSQSTTTLALTSGYFDNPSKYREMANAISTRDQSEELPPACKKRRGLAGSIVSTAVSAALIGTAVGLTVYRLWKGRGKEQPKAITASAIHSSPEFDSEPGHHQHLPPPPPYQEREWSPISHPTPPPSSLESPPTLLPAPTPRKKVARHNVKRSRRARIPRTGAVVSPPRVGAAAAGPSAHPQPEYDFGRDGEQQEEVAGDQMDWIQDKLAQLIEEGKRALNREVVVMSDAKEDEVDDGTGAWEEEQEQDHQQRTSISRSNSIKRTTGKRSRNNVYGGPYGHSTSSHHLSQTSLVLPPPATPRRSHAKAFSTDSVTSLLFKEDESEWQSPELRESMQKARERILASRGTS